MPLYQLQFQYIYYASYAPEEQGGRKDEHPYFRDF